MFFFSCNFFYFDNSPFTTLQNNAVNNQLQVGSITNKVKSAFEFNECLKNSISLIKFQTG